MHAQDQKRGGLRPDRSSGGVRVPAHHRRDHLRKRVVAIDPGERAGVAIGTVSPGRLTKTEAHVMDLDECAKWLAAKQAIASGEETFTGPEFDVIVYETWIPRPIDGDMNWIQGDPLLSAQLVGMIRLCAWLSGARLEKQGPERKKAAFAQIETGMPGSSIVKRRIHSSTEQHDKDALAHLWSYYVKHWKGVKP